VTLWQTVIYFVYKLSLNYRSFKAIAGCPPDSSSSRTARQHTQHAAHRTGCGPTVQILSQKPMATKFAKYKPSGPSACDVQCWRLTASLKQSRKQSLNSGIASGYLGQPITRTDRQDGERLLKLSDWKELGAVSGHFGHSQRQWKSGIWSLVNCVVWLVSAMLLNWCCSLNIF